MMRDLLGFGGCRGGSWKLAILLAAVGAAGDALAGAMAYSVTMLPAGRARFLNNHGDVVLDSLSASASYVRSLDGRLRQLPAPDRVEDLIYIRDMNDAGQVVANYWEVGFGPRSVVFEPDGRLRELLPTGSDTPFAYFVSNQGSVYGAVYRSKMLWPPGSSEGVAYQNTRITPNDEVNPFSASDSGDMAGYAYLGNAAFPVPAVVRSRVEMLLPTSSRQFGWARAMSDDGRWIGGFLEFGFDQDEIPVRWQDDVLEELTMPNGAANAGISGINNDGVGVGNAAANGVQQATIWDAAGVPHLVADVVQTEQAWQFESAVAINNSGQIIGNGYTEVSPGVWDYRGYLLTPIPEPGGVLGLALVGAWAMRRRGI